VVISIDAGSPVQRLRALHPPGHDVGVSLRQQFDQARGGTLFIDDITI
jgi:hypothetical protein